MNMWLISVSVAIVLAACIQVETKNVFDLNPAAGRAFPPFFRSDVKRSHQKVRPNFIESKQSEHNRVGALAQTRNSNVNGLNVQNKIPANFHPASRVEPKLTGIPYILRRKRSQAIKRLNSLLASRAQKKANRQDLRQIRAVNFPLPTVNLPTGMTSQRTEMTTQSSEMTSQSSASIETSSLPSTEPQTYSTETQNPEKCSDDYEECESWLRDYFSNDLADFCGTSGYDSWCCRTCIDWESKPEECKDEYSDCRDMLEDIYNNDYNSFCTEWEDTCCATCSDGGKENKPKECEDKGYQGTSCENLLRSGVDGDMEELCDLFDNECCRMCSSYREEELPGDEVCEDVGYNGSTCKDLLRWGVDGDIEEMCSLFDEECCEMCSDRDTKRKKKAKVQMSGVVN